MLAEDEIKRFTTDHRQATSIARLAEIEIKWFKTDRQQATGMVRLAEYTADCSRQ